MNELDMLREARPEVPAPRQEVLDAALVRVLDDAPDRRRGASALMSRRRVVMAAGLGAVAAVGVGLIPVLGGGGTGTANASVVLQEVAATVRAETEVAPKPDQWVYVESKVRGLPGMGVMWAPGEDADTARPTTSFHIRSWYPAIGREILNCPPAETRKDKRCGPLRFSTVVQQVNGREQRLALVPDMDGWDPMDQAFVRSLPTQRDALLKRIYAHADRKSGWLNFDRDQEAMETIAGLLDGYIPRALRAALFEALSQVPGVRLDRDAVDYAGRHGIGFSRTGSGVTTQIILASKTYRYLGDRLTAVKDLHDGIKAGTDLRWSAQLRIEVVDAARKLPG